MIELGELEDVVVEDMLVEGVVEVVELVFPRERAA